MIYGKLLPSGELTDILNGDGTRSWPDGSIEVSLAEMPSQLGPFTYDVSNKLAVPSASLKLAQDRVAAVTLVDDPVSKALRAVLLAVLDEVNALRQRDMDRAADVAAATSLADLKTRWAARAALAQRTAAGAKQTVKDAINSGQADN